MNQLTILTNPSYVLTGKHIGGWGTLLSEGPAISLGPQQGPQTPASPPPS